MPRRVGWRGPRRRDVTLRPHGRRRRRAPVPATSPWTPPRSCAGPDLLRPVNGVRTTIATPVHRTLHAHTGSTDSLPARSALPAPPGHQPRTAGPDHLRKSAGHGIDTSSKHRRRRRRDRGRPEPQGLDHARGARGRAPE
ncbi:hypothetical protein QJS66_13135 [Kocuria rhizophila]|nr:hypothetical protein QJS66_13135 [Kocuria rhizophila]